MFVAIDIRFLAVVVIGIVLVVLFVRNRRFGLRNPEIKIGIALLALFLWLVAWLSGL